MRKQALMFASCSLGILFLSAPACLAQSVVALDKPSQQEEKNESLSGIDMPECASSRETDRDPSSHKIHARYIRWF